MKTTLILFSIFIASIVNAQQHRDAITTIMYGGYSTFRVIEDQSDKMVDAFFLKHPETKRKGYKWKFKNIQIPGIEKNLTFQVYQGVMGFKNKKCNASGKCSGGSYFHAFSNEKYKQKILENKQANEYNAISIYIKEGRNYTIASKEDSELVKQYLNSLIAL